MTDHQVVMPKLGLTMTEATLAEWHKQDGEYVEKGEPLFTIETEKVTLEIEAPASGMLHSLVAAGETVPVMRPVATLLGTPGEPKPPGEAVAVPTTQPEVSAPAGEPTLAISPHDRGLRASPKARALAHRRGISLEGIIGSGPRGMIVAADVEPAAAAQAAIRVSPVARKLAAEAGLDPVTVDGSGPRGRVMRHDVTRALRGTQETAPAVSPEPAGAAQALTGLRGVIAARLSASWRERPHVTLTTEADATNLVSARQQVIAESGVKVSYNAFLVALVARALREQPHVNVRLGETGIEQLAQVNVGVAVDTERGLLVPVVRDAASKRLIQIHHTLQELVERAIAGRSLPDDLTGGTFTLTNLGAYEIDAFTPIINPPESAILGVGRIINKPVGLNGQIVLRDMLTLSLSFDHRLIDGAPAARFLQRVKQLVERPFALAFSEPEA